MSVLPLKGELVLFFQLSQASLNKYCFELKETKAPSENVRKQDQVDLLQFPRPRRTSSPRSCSGWSRIRGQQDRKIRLDAAQA